MYYVIVREIHKTKSTIAWTKSEFLFREFVRVFTRKYPHAIYHIETCTTKKELVWIYKKYHIPEERMSGDRILLVYDRTKTIYGITTCRSQYVGLGGRSLFQNTEDTIRCDYVHKMFWFMLYIKRFLLLEDSDLVIGMLYQLTIDKYLDSHSIDMYRYFIESDTQTNFFKL